MLLASVDGGIDLGLAAMGLVLLPVGVGVVAGAVVSRRASRVLVGLSVLLPGPVLALLVWNAVSGRSTWLAFAGWGVATVLYLTAMWGVAAPWRARAAGWRRTRRLVRCAAGLLAGGAAGAILVAALAGYVVPTVTWSMIGRGALVGAVVGLMVAVVGRGTQRTSTV